MTSLILFFNSEVNFCSEGMGIAMILSVISRLCLRWLLNKKNKIKESRMDAQKRKKEEFGIKK